MKVILLTVFSAIIALNISEEWTKECQDSKPKDCRYWSTIGECEKNPKWMEKNCPFSCGICGAENCIDYSDVCPGWAKKNLCWGEGARGCGLSCGLCPCEDKDKDCSYWAKIGECKKNPKWMAKNCAKSCTKCHTKSYPF